MSPSPDFIELFPAGGICKGIIELEGNICFGGDFSFKKGACTL